MIGGKHYGREGFKSGVNDSWVHWVGRGTSEATKKVSEAWYNYGVWIGEAGICSPNDDDFSLAWEEA